MIETQVARRYAKSLITLAQERGAVDVIAADMKLLTDVCDQNKDLGLLLASPIIHTDKKLNILKKVFGDKMNPISLAFFEIVTRKGREAHLEGIAKEFTNQYKKYKGIQTAVITSAIGLDDKLRADVYRIVKESLKSEIELVEKVDKNLIGGLILRVGDKQYDASISSELRQLKQELMDKSYIRKN